MPNTTPIQADFSVGEVAPDVQYRSTLEARNRGVRTLTNFYTDSRGPIIRRAGFRFLGKVGEAKPLILNCGIGVEFPTGETEAGGSAASMSIHDWFDEDTQMMVTGDRIVLSKNGIGGELGVIGTYEISTNTWTAREFTYNIVGGTRHGVRHFVGSGIGLTGQNTHIYYQVEYRDGAGNAQSLMRCRLASDWTQDPGISSDVGAVGSEVQFYDESPDYIGMGFQNQQYAVLRQKNNFSAITNLFQPSGYNMGGLMWSQSTNSWLMVCIEINPPNRWGISVIPAGIGGDVGGDLTASAPTKLFSFSGFSGSMYRHHYRDGSDNLYLPFDSVAYRDSLVPTPVHPGFIVRLDNAGDEIRVYSSEDTVGLDPTTFANQNSFNGQSSMYYNAETNRFTGGLNGTILEHDLDTDTWSTCFVTGVPSGNTEFAIIGPDNYMWGVDSQSTAEVDLWRHEIYA